MTKSKIYIFRDMDVNCYNHEVNLRNVHKDFCINDGKINNYSNINDFDSHKGEFKYVQILICIFISTHNLNNFIHIHEIYFYNYD